MLYAAIDLKSFYSSVECHERGLDPLTTNLVVADPSRTEKTICLAVSPSLKQYGLGGRARLFEVLEKVKLINAKRRLHAPGHKFTGKSSDDHELKSHPELELDFIIAPPRMRHYLDYSEKILQIYQQHVAAEDLFPYSIDEIFCDITSYLKIPGLTAAQFVTKIITDVYKQTGITATAGIGTNLFLAKVAMDVIAKHEAPNEFGVRLAELNEISFRQKLWNHRPITDIWRVGPGIARRLASRRMYTMGDVARCSLTDEDILFRLLGVNAELLIDHAWGIEPTTITDVKSYLPKTRSLSNGQVLPRPYSTPEARTIVKEMSESLALEMVDKNFETSHLTLTIVYDKFQNLDPKFPNLSPASQKLTHDRHGRAMPTPSRGSKSLPSYTNSSTELRTHFLELFDRIIKPGLPVRRLYLDVEHLISSTDQTKLRQTDLFAPSAESRNEETSLQKAILKIRRKYGANAILRGTNFDAGATGRTRHRQIGGHAA